jgi:abequosyltransferase
MSRPTLSIVIPTYNRSGLLEHLLHSINDDFDEWPADLELIVLDNASTDSTAEMLAAFAVRRPAISVRRNATNIGMDGNLAACFDAAAGTYFWQIGDDELLFRGSASWVLEFCRTHEFGLLHLANAELIAGRQSAERQRPVQGPLRPVSVDAKTMLRRANIFLTFISANVINRNRILEQFPEFDARAETNTYLPQLAWIYGILTCSSKHFILSTPIFAALAGNTGGYRLVEVFGTNLAGITARRLAKSLASAGRVMSNAALLRLLPGQLISQARRSDQNPFLAEDVGATMEALYGARRYYQLLVRHIIYGGRIRSEAAFLLIRIFNKVDRLTGHRFL